MPSAGSVVTVARALAPSRDRRGGSPVQPGTEARGRARRSCPCYYNRALLLWPRLDRAKLRRYANDPARIAELVEHRTAQPFEVILAMLTREVGAIAPTEQTAGFESGAAHSARMAIRIVTEEDSAADFEAIVIA